MSDNTLAGKSIPFGYGHIRVEGVELWRDSKGTDDNITASWAMGFCEGPAALIALYIGDYAVYDIRGGPVRYLHGLTYRYYEGTEDQEVDDLLHVPHKGLAYVVFQDAKLSRLSSGNELPNVSAIVRRALEDDRPYELTLAAQTSDNAVYFPYPGFAEANDGILLPTNRLDSRPAMSANAINSPGVARLRNRDNAIVRVSALSKTFKPYISFEQRIYGVADVNFERLNPPDGEAVNVLYDADKDQLLYQKSAGARAGDLSQSNTEVGQGTRESLNFGVGLGVDITEGTEGTIVLLLVEDDAGYYRTHAGSSSGERLGEVKLERLDASELMPQVNDIVLRGFLEDNIPKTSPLKWLSLVAYDRRHAFGGWEKTGTGYIVRKYKLDTPEDGDGTVETLVPARLIDLKTENVAPTAVLGNKAPMLRSPPAGSPGMMYAVPGAKVVVVPGARADAETNPPKPAGYVISVLNVAEEGAEAWWQTDKPRIPDGYKLVYSRYSCKLTRTGQDGVMAFLLIKESDNLFYLWAHDFKRNLPLRNPVYDAAGKKTGEADVGPLKLDGVATNSVAEWFWRAEASSMYVLQETDADLDKHVLKRFLFAREGSLDLTPVRDIALDLAERAGLHGEWTLAEDLDEPNKGGVGSGKVKGFLVSQSADYSTALRQLMLLKPSPLPETDQAEDYAAPDIFQTVETPGGLKFVSRGEAVELKKADDVVDSKGWKLVRRPRSDMADELDFTYNQLEGEYSQDTVQAKLSAEHTAKRASEDVPVVMETDEASQQAHERLTRRWRERETATARGILSALQYELGDYVALGDFARGWVKRVSLGANFSVELEVLRDSTYIKRDKTQPKEDTSPVNALPFSVSIRRAGFRFFASATADATFNWSVAGGGRLTALHGSSTVFKPPVLATGKFTITVTAMATPVSTPPVTATDSETLDLVADARVTLVWATKAAAPDPSNYVFADNLAEGHEIDVSPGAVIYAGANTPSRGWEVFTKAGTKRIRFHVGGTYSLFAVTTIGGITRASPPLTVTFDVLRDRVPEDDLLLKDQKLYWRKAPSKPTAPVGWPSAYQYQLSNTPGWPDDWLTLVPDDPAGDNGLFTDTLPEFGRAYQMRVRAYARSGPLPSTTGEVETGDLMVEGFDGDCPDPDKKGLGSYWLDPDAGRMYYKAGDPWLRDAPGIDLRRRNWEFRYDTNNTRHRTSSFREALPQSLFNDNRGWDLNAGRPQNSTGRLALLSDGSVLQVAADGLNYYKKPSVQAAWPTSPETSKPSGITNTPANKLVSIAVDKDDSIYLATSSGFYKQNGATWDAKVEPPYFDPSDRNPRRRFRLLELAVFENGDVLALVESPDGSGLPGFRLYSNGAWEETASIPRPASQTVFRGLTVNAAGDVFVLSARNLASERAIYRYADEVWSTAPVARILSNSSATTTGLAIKRSTYNEFYVVNSQGQSLNAYVETDPGGRSLQYWHGLSASETGSSPRPAFLRVRLSGELKDSAKNDLFIALRSAGGTDIVVAKFSQSRTDANPYEFTNFRNKDGDSNSIPFFEATASTKRVDILIGSIRGRCGDETKFSELFGPWAPLDTFEGSESLEVVEKAFADQLTQPAVPVGAANWFYGLPEDGWVTEGGGSGFSNEKRYLWKMARRVIGNPVRGDSPGADWSGWTMYQHPASVWATDQSPGIPGLSFFMPVNNRLVEQTITDTYNGNPSKAGEYRFMRRRDDGRTVHNPDATGDMEDVDTWENLFDREGNNDITLRLCPVGADDENYYYSFRDIPVNSLVTYFPNSRSDGKPDFSEWIDFFVEKFPSQGAFDTENELTFDANGAPQPREPSGAFVGLHLEPLERQGDGTGWPAKNSKQAVGNYSWFGFSWPRTDGSARENVYRRSADKPSAPPETVRRNEIPEGWFREPPSGTEPLWRASRLLAVGATAGPWRVSFEQVGDTISETFYRRSATKPAAPPTNWAGGPDTAPPGWSTELPAATSTQDIWQAFRSSSRSSFTVSYLEGTVTRERYYIQSANRPADPANTAWGTGPRGWSASRLAATNTLAVWSATRTREDGRTISDWTVEQYLARTTGSPAPVTETYYRLSATAPDAPAASTAVGTPPAQWLRSQPAATSTQDVWQATRNRAGAAYVVSFRAGLRACETFYSVVPDDTYIRYITNRATIADAPPRSDWGVVPRGWTTNPNNLDERSGTSIVAATRCRAGVSQTPGAWTYSAP